MSKSILVIDTPSNCEQCPFVRHCIDCIPEDYCTLDKSKRDIINSDIKPDWCPAKEVPEKKVPIKIYDKNLGHYYISAFDKGYNKCIDEILKETNQDEKPISSLWGGGYE